MGLFQWISPRPLPGAFDLRARGWRLAPGPMRGEPGCAGLVDTAVAELSPERFSPALRRRALALGLGDSDARARWLAAGFADALPAGARLDEIEQRARRVLSPPPAAVLRPHPRLALELVARDARIDGRRLRLNPREFALLWRLAEARGEPVAKEDLLRDVWDLRFDPGTNSLAVHVCRLRKKLAGAGLANLVVTGPGDGAYRLGLAGEARPERRARGQIGLDLPRGLREQPDPIEASMVEEAGR